MGGVPALNAYTAEECVERCYAVPACVSADFNLRKTAGVRCFLHMENKEVYPTHGVDHYVVVNKCTGWCFVHVLCILMLVAVRCM